MQIPDEVIEAVTGMHPEQREYPDGVRKDFHSAAEWARKEALREAVEAIGPMRPEVGTHINVGPYRQGRFDGLTAAMVKIRALAEGDTNA
jgi:hypothetical protein